MGTEGYGENLENLAASVCFDMLHRHLSHLSLRTPKPQGIVGFAHTSTNSCKVEFSKKAMPSLLTSSPCEGQPRAAMCSSVLTIH